MDTDFGIELNNKVTYYFCYHDLFLDLVMGALKSNCFKSREVGFALFQNIVDFKDNYVLQGHKACDGDLKGE
jgi:hypothetical protein